MSTPPPPPHQQYTLEHLYNLIYDVNSRVMSLLDQCNSQSRMVQTLNLEVEELKRHDDDSVSMSSSPDSEILSKKASLQTLIDIAIEEENKDLLMKLMTWLKRREKLNITFTEQLVKAYADDHHINHPLLPYHSYLDKDLNVLRDGIVKFSSILEVKDAAVEREKKKSNNNTNNSNIHKFNKTNKSNKKHTSNPKN